jgi:uncharacterized protein YjiS (DUF1127 family)
MIAIVLVLNAAIPWSASIFLLPAIWRRRARFREQLRADIGTAPDFLRDIGIDVPEAQAEAMRFFWEPVTLQRKTGDATARSISRYSRQTPAKARLSAPTRPTICASQNPQTRGCIFAGKHDDALARVTSS